MSPAAPQPRFTPARRFHGPCLLLLGLCLLLSSALRASPLIPSAPAGTIESGRPAFIFFGPEALGLQAPPSDLAELPDGRIVAVSQRQLAMGDGVRWELYQSSESEREIITQSLAIDARGRLYAGISTGFAQIEFQSDGRWHFTLLAPMPERERRLWPVFSVAHRLGSHWLWSSNSGAILQWDLGGAPTLVGHAHSIDHLFKIGERTFVSDLAQGSLLELKDGKESPVGPFTLRNAITSSTPFDNEHVLVGTNSSGVHLFNGRELRPFSEHELGAIENKINDIKATHGGFFAVAVDNHGIVFLDRKGRVVQHLDRSLDLRLSQVQKLLVSADGVIWGLCNEGVVRVDFPSRISHFEHHLLNGLNFVEPMRHQGRLWLMANGKALRGLYNDQSRLLGFRDASPQGQATFALHAEGTRLFATTDEGILDWQEGRGWLPVLSGPKFARILCRDPKGGDRWLYCAENELGWLDFEGGATKATRHAVENLGMSYGAVQDAAGFIWLELGTGLVARIDPAAPQPSLERFDQSHGIPDSWAGLSVVKGIVRMTCANRLLLFNPQSQRWEDDLAMVRSYPELAFAIGRPTVDAQGRLWVSGPDKVRIVSEAQPAEIETLPDELHPYNFVCEESGVVWMHDKRRFARYDPSIPKSETRPPRAVITRVDLPGSGRTLVSPKGNLGELQNGDNTLVAHFLAPGNPFGQRVSFEIRMEGVGEQWVSTGIVGSAVFNRLKEGNYVFRVRPRVADKAGEEAVLSFSIRPPWYRTPLAYAGFAVLGLVCAVLLVSIPIHFERRHQNTLKSLVSIRTRELRETNEQLRVLVDEARLKAAALKESEDRYKRLSTELEQRVNERTEELRRRVTEVEQLNADLQASHEETERAAARLQEVNANLLVANHELESFSYTVSHDLRAPLRNITGFMEILAKRIRQLDEKESNRQLDIVISEARRMSLLIDDLLTFSRIGRIQMSMATVQLGELIAEAKRELANELRARDIEWVVSELPPVVGDRTLLRQVIVNLLENAVKFTRRQTRARIEIGFQPKADSPGTGIFHVRDNGAGFNPQYVDKLFRVFQRLHNARDFEGTGIGLANVKRIIARHGGHIWAEGAVNAGATFHFTLRLASAEASTTGQRAHTPS